jgi:CRISPR type IV-associated protein Csf2
MASNQRRTVTVQGVLTLTGHAHQTAAGEKPEGLAPQMKTSSILDGTLNEGESVANLPYFTMNSVRGLTRRACGGVIMRELERSENKISKNLYLSIMRGSFARTGIAKGGATYQQLIAEQDHLFAGLWGGGAYMYPSKISGTRDLFPMITATKFMFPQRYQEYCINVPASKLIARTMMAPRDDLNNLPEYDVIENASDAYMEHMAAKFGANKAKKDQKAASKAEGKKVKIGTAIKSPDLDNYGEIESVIPGTPLYLGYTLKDVTDAQIGLFLSAVALWADRNVIGGGSARGRGSFSANLQVFEKGELLIDQLLTGDAPYYKLSAGADPFVKAMKSQLEDAAKPAALESIYPSIINEKDSEEASGAPASVEQSTEA